jgi:hypothetical protein
MNEIIHTLYWYCTDFCIHMSTILGITYVEFNFWMFMVIFPLIFVILLALNLYRYLIYPIIRKRFL